MQKVLFLAVCSMVLIGVATCLAYVHMLSTGRNRYFELTKKCGVAVCTGYTIVLAILQFC